MNNPIFSHDGFASCARQVCAEGTVLLRNENSVLPLPQGTRIALFGRSQLNYYKSGTGSGGMVNVSHVVDIPEALEQSGLYTLNETVRAAYAQFVAEHPYDMGAGWGQEPWFQAEMPLSEELVRTAASESDAAVIILARSSGEDHDNDTAPGSYLLTEQEHAMLKAVCSAFKKTVVLLNVGNIIDMSWVEQYRPSAVLYVWQGGEIGGLGVLDVLSGVVAPSGKLTDTIAASISDYPSTKNFGDKHCNRYEEDIYVGYRYFETFAPEQVLYPFGFGLSYTSFVLTPSRLCAGTEGLALPITVTNAGSAAGKETVQCYVRKPQGYLGNPARSLCAYQKTKLLAPGESEEIVLRFPWRELASYDDSGCTGKKSAFLLEEGAYVFYVGTDVRSAEECGSIDVCEPTVIEQLEEALAPQSAGMRLRPVVRADGKAVIGYEALPLRSASPLEHRANELPAELPYTGDLGYRLSDVRDGTVPMETFIAQLSDEELCCIQRGEGMNSPKVTAGTGGAFGGVTDALQHYGIPLACCTDGPSGIRMDCGAHAFSMPNGTLMACTFNDALIEELFVWEGKELRMNKIDALLGPGMNIHRSPLNGRNFEYFSEDPLLSGKIAAAQLRGLHTVGVTGTIKHFATNNQETSRNFVNAVVSERALREIYLRGFEIAVKEGNAVCIMSTYSPLNGCYTSSSYDLLTSILRRDWGYKGLVMTDWWARGGDENEKGDSRSCAQMARAQNDLYMVVKDALVNSGADNLAEGLAEGIAQRGEYQRNAANICRVVMQLPCYERFHHIETQLDRDLASCLPEEDLALGSACYLRISDGSIRIEPEMISTEGGASTVFQVSTAPRGVYRLRLRCRAASASTLAQMSLSVFQDKALAGMVSLTGEHTEAQDFDIMLSPAFMGDFFLKFYCAQPGLMIEEAALECVENMEEKILAIMASWGE